jgi:hypothetical protein
MQQIADWLKTLGLTQYVQAFADNDIDFSVLGYLTDQDLEKIGVSLGHRRKILAAIAGLVGAVPTAPKLALTKGKLKTPLNAGSSPSCLRTSLARLPSRPSSTPRTCTL